MHNARRWSAGVSASAVLMFVGGCGDAAPAVTNARTEATVTGTVMIKGKLASSGSVIFDAANSERRDLGPVKAPIGKDGSYSVKTLVGSNRVTISGKDLIKEAPEIQYDRRSFDVQSGDNTYNIDLPTKK